MLEVGLGFFPSFSLFWLPRNSMGFFQRKDRGSCFWDQRQDTTVQFSSRCVFALWYGNHRTTAASQHCCSPDFPFSWLSLTKTSHLSRPQKWEHSHYFILFFFSCNCTREGCTSAARGCSTSAQEIPQSRNIYLHRRHWCSVLITVAWAGDQDTAHRNSLSSQWY